MYPRSGFRSGEHPPKPTLLEPPFCEPPISDVGGSGLATDPDLPKVLSDDFSSRGRANH